MKSKLRENVLMEFEIPKQKRKKRNNCTRNLLQKSSLSSFSSESSQSYFLPYKCTKRRKKTASYSKRDYLTRLFERKKLKERSLSKKVKTPFDRKLYRTCWPIELKKVSRIKKKPREKGKEKPTYRSLTKKKFSNPTLGAREIIFRERSPPISCSELEFLDDTVFSKVYHLINKKHFLFEIVTPEMLMSALQDPEYLDSGATIDMIIIKLRALNLELNPSKDLLRKEILQKLICAIKLGLVIENNGYYKIADAYRKDDGSKQKINAVWKIWYRRMKKIRN